MSFILLFGTRLFPRREGARRRARSGARGDCRAARAGDQAGLLQEAEAELADLDGRLHEAQSGRPRAEARCGSSRRTWSACRGWRSARGSRHAGETQSTDCGLPSWSPT